MRVFKKILSFIFVIAFIFSVSVSVIFMLSSTNKLMFKDNVDSRLKLYYSSYYNLTNSKNYTIVSENKYGEDQRSEDKITCSLDFESQKLNNCSQISYLYNSDGSIARTSYFPGDGFKYSIEGTTKTKVAYTNESLQNYFLSLVSGASYYLNYVVYDILVPTESEFSKYDTDIKFDFNTFSFLKNMDLKIEKDADKFSVSYTFDGKDRLTNISMEEGISLNISYKKTNFQFPSFNGYEAV